MLINITGVSIHDGVVAIFGTDVSDENLQRIERNRVDDGYEEELSFVFDGRIKNDFLELQRWLHRQKAATGKKTYGEALRATVGTITTINGKFRSWD